MIYIQLFSVQKQVGSKYNKTINTIYTYDYFVYYLEQYNLF